VGGAGEIAGGDRGKQVATKFAMIPADPAFAGVVRKASSLGSAVEGANGVCAERAEAHGGNVKQRQGVGLAARGAAHGHTKAVTIGRTGNDRVIDPLEVVAINVLLSAKWPFVECALRPLVGNSAFRSIERRAVGFTFQEILTDFRSNLFQHEANVGEDWIIAPDAMAALRKIPNADCTQYSAEQKQPDEYDVVRNQHAKNDRSNQTCRER